MFHPNNAMLVPILPDTVVMQRLHFLSFDAVRLEVALLLLWYRSFLLSQTDCSDAAYIRSQWVYALQEALKSTSSTLDTSELRHSSPSTGPLSLVAFSVKTPWRQQIGYNWTLRSIHPAIAVAPGNKALDPEGFVGQDEWSLCTVFMPSRSKDAKQRYTIRWNTTLLSRLEFVDNSIKILMRSFLNCFELF